MRMNLKEHILAALQEQFESWEKLLSSLDEKEITTPHFDFDWSIKDVMAHLWAWQQISIARLASGVQGREPEYPQWILAIGEDWEEDSDRVNALTFENSHEKPWALVYRNWKSGFLHFLGLANKISE